MTKHVSHHAAPVVPAPWLKSDTPDAKRSVVDLVREWRLIEAKAAYDLQVVADDRASETAALEAAKPLWRRQAEIEKEIVGRGELATYSDVIAALDLVLHCGEIGWATSVADEDGATTGILRVIRATLPQLELARREEGRQVTR